MNMKSDLIAGWKCGAVALALSAAAAWGAAEAALSPALVALAAASGGALGLLAGGLIRRDTGAARSAPAQPAPPTERPAAGLRAGYGREVLVRLPNPLILLDAAGEVAFANEAAADLYRQAAIGAHYTRVFRNPALLDAIEAAFSRQEARDVEFDMLRERETYIHATVRPFDRKDGAWSDPAMAVLVLMEDHTKARRAEILHRDFVANASHEFKTPLASVAGFIETLQGHARSDEAARDRFLAIMAAQTDRMKRLVEDLLSLNRIELDEHVRPRGVVRLNDVARGVAAELGPLSDGRLAVEFDDQTARVNGDLNQLSQVFLNLVDNALKYGDAGAPVRVAAAPDSPDHPGMIGVQVIDQGEGIPAEHLPRLTERFYRVSVSRSRERGGTGLGLAIVKHIVKRHRGDLEIRSEPGKGSVFTVWLPRAAAETDQSGKAGNRGARADAA